MKKLLFLTLFIACSAAAQDVTTRLTVRAKNYPADSIRLRWATDNGTMHSKVMHLTGGIASTTLEMPDRTQIIIDRFDDDFIEVYSEDGNVEVALDNDLWPEAAISGGPFNTDHGRYWVEAGHLERLIDSAWKVINTTHDGSEFERLQGQKRAETYRFIAENPDSEYSAYLIQVSLDRDNAEMFDGLYRKLSERVRTDTPEGIFAGKRIAETLVLRVGNPAPPFSKTDMNGNKVSLADFRGNWVLIDPVGRLAGIFPGGEGADEALAKIVL